MGYCGAPSKGCEICRMRKIKCDRSGTPCNNCIVHKRVDECSYRNQLDLNFRIVSHSTLAAQVKKDQARRRERKHRKLAGQSGDKKQTKDRSATAGGDSSDEASVSSRSSSPEIGANASPIEGPPVGPNGVREYKWDYFTVEDWEREEGVRSTPSVAATPVRGVPNIGRTPSPIQERQPRVQQVLSRTSEYMAQSTTSDYMARQPTNDYMAQPSDYMARQRHEWAVPQTQMEAKVPMVGKHLYPLQTSHLPPVSAPLSESSSLNTPATYGVQGTPAYQFVPTSTTETPSYYQNAFVDSMPYISSRQSSQQPSLPPLSSTSSSSLHQPPMTMAPSTYSAYHTILPPPGTNSVPRTSHLQTLSTHRPNSATSSPHIQQQQHSRQHHLYSHEPHTCQGGSGDVASGIEIWGCKACLSAGHYAWHVRDGVTLYPVKNAAGEWGCGQCWAWMERFSQNQQLYAALGL